MKYYLNIIKISSDSFFFKHYYGVTFSTFFSFILRILETICATQIIRKHYRFNVSVQNQSRYRSISIHNRRENHNIAFDGNDVAPCLNFASFSRSHSLNHSDCETNRAMMTITTELFFYEPLSLGNASRYPNSSSFRLSPSFRSTYELITVP